MQYKAVIESTEAGCVELEEFASNWNEIKGWSCKDQKALLRSAF